MPGRVKVCICMGSSCFSRGNNRLLERLKSFVAEHGLEERVAMSGSRCEGHCGDGPNVRVNGRLHSRMTPEAMITLLKGSLDGE